MSEWKELKIDNLPSDILTGEYEFEYCQEEQSNWHSYLNSTVDGRINILGNTNNGNFATRYRKPEPKAPTHEEIMTLCWFDDSQKEWFRITSYTPIGKFYSTWLSDDVRNYDKSWFTGCESAVTPPEADA